MIVEFNLMVSRLAAVLAVAKWQESHNEMVRWTWYNDDGRSRMARAGWYQEDQRLTVTEAGTLRYDGRRHCVRQDSVGYFIRELCAPVGRNVQIWDVPAPVVYETSDDRLAWYETAEDADRREYWAEVAEKEAAAEAEMLRCESGGSRSRRHG